MIIETMGFPEEFLNNTENSLKMNISPREKTD
jgi:hypothetical protein